MTTCLFDTNAWIRVTDAPHELSKGARERVYALPDPVGLSAMSVWEITLKVRKGRFSLKVPLDAWLRAKLAPAFVQVLPVDAKIARLSNELPGDFHEDPADRIIVATAIHHDLTLFTSDRLILACPYVKTFDTR